MPEVVRIVVIAGIRPQFVKMAALLNSIGKHNQISQCQIHTTCINTCQHYDDLLAVQIIRDLGLSFDFEISHKSRSPDAILANSFIELSRHLRWLTPDWIIVFGDGNPAMVGALASARQGHKLVHIEAGERRERYEHEEINRRVIDTLSNVYFCVSQRAVSCLAEEGITRDVYWTGDLAYEFTMKCVQNLSPGIDGEVREGYVLVTIHRPENLEAKVLKNISIALDELSRESFFICHPRTKHRLQDLNLWNTTKTHYLNPLSFFESLSAIKGCAYLFTDSGGMIREASHLGKRCVVRRNRGAWPELIDIGFNIKVGTSIIDLRDGFINMETLCRRPVSPPEVLYRPKGVDHALDILCTLSS